MRRVSVLIVEDEVVVAMDIENALKAFDYEVVGHAQNSAEAFKIFETTRPDIVLLDINLGEGDDGISTAQKLQAQYASPFGIIYITAFGDDANIERAVKTMPSAYILKPFKRDELKAALKIARYRLGIDAPIICADDDRTLLGDGFSYLAKTDALYFHDNPIALGKKESSLLRLLVTARGQVVDFGSIDYEVWGDALVDDNTRRTLIYRLRCKLNHTNIDTIPRVGCKINIANIL